MLTLPMYAGVGTVLTTCGYFTGYVYGAVFNLNRNLAAQAFAIAAVANITLQALVSVIAGRVPDLHSPLFMEPKRPRLFYTLTFVTSIIVPITQIIAFRKLNLIATPGTVLFAFAGSIGLVSSVFKMINAYQISD